MPIVDFLPYATDPGANVESQASYAADPTTTEGQASGLARSAVFNKIWRQGNFVASAIANFISQTSSVDVLDDGNLTTFITKFKAALTTWTWANPTFTGTVNAPTVAGTTDNTTKVATTAFVQAVRALLAPLTSPAFLGTPTAPTPAATDNSTKLATTKFVNDFLANYTYSHNFVGLSTSSSGSSAHSMGGPPTALYAYLVCTSNDLGYVPGDHLTIPADVTSAVWANATLVGYSISNTGLSSVPKAGGGTAGLNLANWSITIVGRWY